MKIELVFDLPENLQKSMNHTDFHSFITQLSFVTSLSTPLSPVSIVYFTIFTIFPTYCDLFV